MARGFRSRGSLPAPKRQIANDGFGGFATMAFGVSTTVTQIGGVGFQLLVPAATLIRTRGVFSAQISASGTINNIVRITMGMTVVNLEAFNIGLTAVPTPNDDIERPWFLWETMCVTATNTSVDQGAFGHIHQVKLDSRGMRKLKSDEVLAVTFEGEQLASTSGTIVQLAYGVRQQFKL